MMPSGVSIFFAAGRIFFWARPGDVDGDKIHWLRKNGVHGVGAFHDDDARVFAELPFEDAVAGVDGVNFLGTMLEETIDEPAGVGTEVGADFLRWEDLELVEGVFELLTGAGDEFHLGYWKGFRERLRRDGRGFEGF